VEEEKENIMEMEMKKHEQPLLVGGVFDEFPYESTWDVIIIGGGPNGLMAAAYLAKAGLKVILLERRYEIGGGLVTEEIMFPCYYSNAHVIYHLMADYMPVMKDFNLDNHGMAWIKPNLQAAMVFNDGGSLLLTRMVEDTRDSFMRYSVNDGIAFGKVMRTWRKIVDEIIAPMTYIPAMSPMDLSIMLEKTDIGHELLELSEKSPYEIITENFENDRIRAFLLYISCMCRPFRAAAVVPRHEQVLLLRRLAQARRSVSTRVSGQRRSHTGHMLSDQDKHREWQGCWGGDERGPQV
jgi:phytoene dehydrogenase-like protein